MRKISYIFLSLLLAVPVAYAQQLKESSRAWNVFTIDQDGRKVCYITSAATNKTGNYKRRGEPYVLVTYRGDGVSEVSISSGYPYKAKSTVNLAIEDKKYELFTTDETPKIAWANDADEDKSIVESMKQGNSLIAKGTSKLGTYSKDTYSLMGFSKAHEKMTELCAEG